MLAASPFGYLTDYALWWLIYASLLIHTWCFFRFFPRDTYRRTGLVAGNALVFVCLLGFAALLGETYYRFVAVGTDAFGVSLPAQRWFALHVRLNSLGCRDREWAVEKPPGVYRIAFVGDSFVYGWGIERVEDRFPDRIQEKFDGGHEGTQLGRAKSEERRAKEGADPSSFRSSNFELRTSGFPFPNKPLAHARRVEIFNVAKPGWGTGDQIQPVRDLIDVYGADEVVLCYVPNDIEKLLPRTPHFDPIRPPEPKRFNPTISALFDSLYYRVWLPRVPTVRQYHDWLAEGFAEPELWQRHQEQLFAIISACRERGAKLRVVLLPFLRTGGDKYQAERLHGLLREFFQRNGVEVLDLLPVVDAFDPADLTVSRFDAHPNGTAHALFARAIWKAFYTTVEQQ